MSAMSVQPKLGQVVKHRRADDAAADDDDAVMLGHPWSSVGSLAFTGLNRLILPTTIRLTNLPDPCSFTLLLNDDTTNSATRSTVAAFPPAQANQILRYAGYPEVQSGVMQR
jgi:hypothetical protein